MMHHRNTGDDNTDDENERGIPQTFMGDERNYPSIDPIPKKKRKRRTKAEMEAYRLS